MKHYYLTFLFIFAIAMKIEIIRHLTNVDLYFITIDNEVQFHLRYDKANDSTELFFLNETSAGILTDYYATRGQIFPFKIIRLPDFQQEEIILRRKSIFWNTYTFTYKLNTFEIIRHFGCSFSFFLEGNQVGYYKVCGGAIGSGNMELILNSDLEPRVFVLVATSLYSNFGSEGSYSNEPFSLWFQKRPFNKSWKPK
ncbi:MAG: hypothetical protein SFU20_04870 [Chitinophagaceae bacterium]|nr:hypothetical protein [Chitinophagaceae bacterium]